MGAGFPSKCRECGGLYGVCDCQWTDEDERRVAELLAPPAPDARCTICKLEWVDAANGFDTCQACLKRQ